MPFFTATSGQIFPTTLGALSLLLTLAPGPVRAGQEIEAPLGCVDTVVTKSLAPTGTSMASGGELVFRDDIAPGHGAAGQGIRILYVAPGYDTVADRGDHVRVCLLQMPLKTAYCNPATDIRGREFLVFDTSKPQGENAGVFFNGEHLCGGA